MKFKDRIKSYKFWVGLSASIVILLQALGDAFGFTVSEEIIQGITMGFCGVLVVFGIVEQPQAEKELDELFKDEENKVEEVQKNKPKQIQKDTSDKENN